MPADKKPPERTEGAAAAVQAKHGDSRSAKRAQTGPTSFTSFGGDFTLNLRLFLVQGMMP